MDIGGHRRMRLSDICRRGQSYWRFAVVGFSNTAVDFSVFTILKAIFHMNFFICQVVAFSAGIINSFILNKKWTFESQTARLETSVQLCKFVLVNIMSLSISLLGLKLLNGNLSVNIYWAKVAVTVITQAINYSGYRWWVFSGR